MINNAGNSRKIAKNSLFLYLRMFFIMAVSLYTSRVVLDLLGIEDFGIYNVVGGVVAMFSFLSSAMAVSTQRFLTFEMGNDNNNNQLKNIFCTSVNIHIFIAVIVFVVGETIGLWFLFNKMIIPQSREIAVFWVYQCAILSSIVLILSIPYNALIIAHEKMSAFAYISILEASLKLGIVFLLYISDIDKLIIYSFLMLFMQLIIRIIYGKYCRRRFKESEYRFNWDKKLFKEMLSFAGWNSWGNFAFIGFTQGLNVLLNMYFGPSVNAARAISVQIQNTVNQFSTSFQTAVNPQITKSYATGNKKYMHNLIFISSRFTFFMLFLLTIPLFVETKKILVIWLNIVPDYTIIFVRLMLCVTIVDAIANPLIIAAGATGKIKKYQSVIGSLLLSIVPISYFVLKFGGYPYSVFYVHLIMCILSFVIRLFFVKQMINLSLKRYFREVIFRILGVILPVSILVLFLQKIINPSSILCVIFMQVLYALVGIMFVFVLGLSTSEKQFLINKLTKLKKIKYSDE